MKKGQNHDMALFAALAALAFLLIGAALSGPSEEDLQRQQYCDMVAMNKQDPETGWPDFHGTFEQECKEHAR